MANVLLIAALGLLLSCQAANPSPGPAAQPLATLTPRAHLPYVTGGGTGAAQPADLYVSPQGHDENDGRSPSTAFRTLQRATEVVQPGQTILVLPGTYHQFAQVYDLRAAEAPIVIRGAQAVFDGQRSLGSAFQCWECTNVVVENLTVQSYKWEGVGFFQSRRITIRDLHVQDTGFKIHRDTGDGGSGITVLESERVTVENNALERTGMRIALLHLSGYGLDLWGCRDCVVRGNTVRAVTGTGILVEESCSVVVESNTVEDGEMEMRDWWDGGLWLDGGHDVTVRDNVFQNNHGPGIQVSDEGALYPEGSYGFVLENNVSRDNEFGIYVWNYGACPPPEDGVRMSGNDVSGNRQEDMRCVEWECGEGEPCAPPPDDSPC